MNSEKTSSCACYSTLCFFSQYNATHHMSTMFRSFESWLGLRLELRNTSLRHVDNISSLRSRRLSSTSCDTIGDTGTSMVEKKEPANAINTVNIKKSCLPILSTVLFTSILNTFMILVRSWWILVPMLILAFHQLTVVSLHFISKPGKWLWQGSNSGYLWEVAMSNFGRARRKQQQQIMKQSRCRW